MKIASFKAGPVASYGIVTDAGIIDAGRRLWMKGGDVVEVEISGIGILRNPVKDEIAASAERAA